MSGITRRPKTPSDDEIDAELAQMCEGAVPLEAYRSLARWCGLSPDVVKRYAAEGRLAELIAPTTGL